MLKQLENLQSFVRVVERGSFSGVANEMGSTQPRITRHIQAIEADLGARLFERSTRGLKLTDAGKRFYEVAQRMLALAEEAQLSVDGEHKALSGKLRVVAPVVFGELVLADIAANFQRQHAEVHIELLLSDRNVNLIEEGAHCAFRGGALDDSSMIAVPLGFSVGILAATQHYISTYGNPATPKDLQNHKLSAFHPRSPISELQLVHALKPQAKPSSVPVNSPIFSTTSQTAARIASSGHMLAVLPHYAMQWYAKHFDFVRVLPDYYAKPNPVHAIFPSKHGITARSRAFVDFVASQTKTLLSLPG